jgi:hypothetical protein
MTLPNITAYRRGISTSQERIKGSLERQNIQMISILESSMDEFKITVVSRKSDPLERSRILAKVYDFLLSLPDPGNNIEPAAGYLGRDAATGSGVGSPIDIGEALADSTRRVIEEGHHEL